MRSLNLLVGVFLTLALSACGGGGGGSGGGSSTDPGGGGGGTPGSALFKNATVEATDPTNCIKNGSFVLSFTHTSQTSCQSAGGTWSVNPSVPTGERCVIGSITYAHLLGGTASAETIAVCEAFGGTYLASTNEAVGSCTGGTAPTCAEVGGTEVSLLAVSGEIDQDSVALKPGNNNITGESGNNGLSCTIQDSKGCNGLSATERPFIFYASTKIKLGVDRWQSTIMVPTGANFTGYNGYPGDTTSFSVSLPMSTGTRIINSFEASLRVEFPILFYLPN